LLIRRYEAENMATALKKIRADMGPNAFVLSTRKIKKRDSAGRMKIMMEVSAATDLVEIESKDGGSTRHSRGQSEHHEISTLKQQIDQIKQELSEMKVREEPDSMKSLRDDVSEIRGLVELATDQWAETTVKGCGPVLSALFKRLHHADIDRRLAAGIIGMTSRELTDSSIGNEKDAFKVLMDVMRRQLKTAGPIDLLSSGPKVVILVGPTGVGKTTTLAKIAAHYSMLRRKKVGLLTIDTFRIGAVEQLGTYANILELPLKVANTPRQMRSYVNEYRDMDLVLVDTGGRSHKDRAKMAELLSFVGDRDDMYYEVYLLLSAATKNRDLIEITREFGKMAIDNLVFTKLDECNSFGGLFNEVVWTQKPLSYLTTGQNVPEDIEVAEPRRIVELILRGKLGLDRNG